MKGMGIKQNILNFQCPFKSLYLEKKTHYPIPILALNVLVYICEVKKRCRKKCLNKLAFAADSLNIYEPDKFHTQLS